MGKKSKKPRKQKASATCILRDLTGLLVPLSVDLAAIDPTLCCHCKKDLEPESWKENEYVLHDCCGACSCHECYDETICSEGKEKLVADEIRQSIESNGTSSTDIMPSAIRIFRRINPPCPTCNSLPPKSQKERLQRFQRLADAGQPRAQYTLACKLVQGIDGARQDIPKAMALYRKAADQGHTMAMSAICDRYMKGDGVEPQSYQKAKLWAEKCIDTNAIAQDALGHIYLNGLGGVTQADEVKAMELFQLSAQQGFPPGISDYMTSLMQAGREKDALEWSLKGGMDETRLSGY